MPVGSHLLCDLEEACQVLRDVLLPSDEEFDAHPCRSDLTVEPSGKSPVRQRFTLEIYGKQVIAISAYWQQMIFGGKGVPPPERTSDADVVAFVRDTPGAIGYAWSGSDLSGVKVVAVTD